MVMRNGSWLPGQKSRTVRWVHLSNRAGQKWPAMLSPEWVRSAGRQQTGQSGRA